MKTYNSELLGARVNTEHKIIFFWNGIFSQWEGCNINIPELDVTVKCAEQAMMLFKAKEFNDMESFDAILNSDHPRQQKAIGRRVKNYDDVIWTAKRYDYVKLINLYKFSQNKAWKELLLLTDPYELTEASPEDHIWGIGMGMDHPALLNRKLWGQNLLGKAIMDVRASLLAL